MKRREKFLRALSNKKKLSEYIDAIDWLLDDERLHGLKNKNKFTTKIKNYAKENNIIFRELTDDDVIEEKTIYLQTEKYFYYSKISKSICEKTVRNVRNSIAHGKCYIETVNGETLFVAEDFKQNGELSAIIRVPLSMLKFLRDIYIQCLNENLYSDKVMNKTSSKKELSKV